MNRYILLGLSALIFYPAFTQTGKIIKLEDCYRKAQEQYPLRKQASTLQAASAIRLENIHQSRLPDLQLNGRASMQSENVKLPLELPPTVPIKLPDDLPLERFQVQVDGNYTLYDGGLRAAQKLVEKAGLHTQLHNLEVETNKIKTQVNQPFFGVLLLREKLRILANSKQDLEQRIPPLEAAVRNGVRTPGDVDRLKAQVLKMDADMAKTRGDIRALLAILSTLTGDTLAETIELSYPNASVFEPVVATQRLEWRLFDLQKEQILSNSALIDARRKPKVSAFVQAGFGYPNPLNFFEASLSPFAILGVQGSWKITDWKQNRRERELLNLQTQLVDNQRETFSYNLNLLDGKYQEDWNAIQEQLQKQEAIIALHTRILKESAAQLREGVITTTDYVTASNAEVQAQLLLETYKLQLQQLHIDYLTLKGQL